MRRYEIREQSGIVAQPRGLTAALETARRRSAESGDHVVVLRRGLLSRRWRVVAVFDGGRFARPRERA